TVGCSAPPKKVVNWRETAIGEGMIDSRNSTAAPSMQGEVLEGGGEKPHLIVVAEGIHPKWGSEHGKGWWWSSALSKYFQLHIVCSEVYVAEASSHEEAIANQWRFYPVENTITTWKYGIGYFQYMLWLDRALEVIRG